MNGLYPAAADWLLWDGSGLSIQLPDILSAPNSQPSFGPDVEKALAELSDTGRQTVTRTLDGMHRALFDRDQRMSRMELGLKERVARLELELKLREKQLRLARMEKYGPKGEKLSMDQVLLLNLEPGDQAGKVAKEAALLEADRRLPKEAPCPESQEVLERDNNGCENGMRPMALGPKNGMHPGCERSGPPVAAIMTVLASAQRAGVNIRRFLIPPGLRSRPSPAERGC